MQLLRDSMPARLPFLKIIIQIVIWIKPFTLCFYYIILYHLKIRLSWKILLMSNGLCSIKVTKKDVMNRRIGPISRRNLVAVMSSANGKLALVIYSQQKMNFRACYTRDVPSDDTLNACTKITTFFKHAGEVQKTYKGKSFVVCGSFETVKNSLLRLKK